VEMGSPQAESRPLVRAGRDEYSPVGKSKSENNPDHLCCTSPQACQCGAGCTAVGAGMGLIGVCAAKSGHTGCAALALLNTPLSLIVAAASCLYSLKTRIPQGYSAALGQRISDEDAAPETGYTSRGGPAKLSTGGSSQNDPGWKANFDSEEGKGVGLSAPEQNSMDEQNRTGPAL